MTAHTTKLFKDLDDVYPSETLARFTAHFSVLFSLRASAPQPRRVECRGQSWWLAARWSTVWSRY